MRTVCLLIFFSLSIIYPIQSKTNDDPQYVGVKKCKVCHATDDIGNQYRIWESSLHAKAYKTLSNEESKAIGKERGLKVPPNESPECLECHVTGYGMPDSLFATPIVKENGIHCETCHGPGSEYKKIDNMLDRDKALASGLTLPIEETCTRCHNEKSPKYKPFNFDEFIKKIEHKVPEGYSWEVEDDDEGEDEELW